MRREGLRRTCGYLVVPDLVRQAQRREDGPGQSRVCPDRGDAGVSAPAPVFLGHMLAQIHGVIWTTNAEVGKDKLLAAQIFGGKPEELLIGECHGQDRCVCFLAIQALVELISRRKLHFNLWHVYSTQRRQRETGTVKDD
jgi:hypothetical protein